MSTNYVFVGTECVIGDLIRLTRLGQVVSLTEEQYRVAVTEARSKAPLVTEAQFASVGFTSEELRRHATPDGQVSAGDGFRAKLAAVRALIGQEEEE